MTQVDYLDTVHLNQRGVRRFSSDLGQALVAQGIIKATANELVADVDADPILEVAMPCRLPLAPESTL